MSEDVTVAVWVDLDVEDGPGMAPGTYRVGVRSHEISDLSPAARGAASARYEVGWQELPQDLAGAYREALAWVPAGAVVEAPQVSSAGVEAHLLSLAFEALGDVPGPLPAWRQVSGQRWLAELVNDGRRPYASVWVALGRQGQEVGWCAQVEVAYGDIRTRGPFEAAEEAKAWCEREVWR